MTGYQLTLEVGPNLLTALKWGLGVGGIVWLVVSWWQASVVLRGR